MRKLFLAYIPVLLLASACTKNIQDLNQDQKSAVTVPAATVFLAGEKNLVDNMTNTGGGTEPFRFFAQTWTQITYVTEAQYKLTTYNAPDNWWGALYGGSGSGVLPAWANGVAAASASKERHRDL